MYSNSIEIDDIIFTFRVEELDKDTYVLYDIYDRPIRASKEVIDKVLKLVRNIDTTDHDGRLRFLAFVTAITKSTENKFKRLVLQKEYVKLHSIPRGAYYSFPTTWHSNGPYLSLKNKYGKVEIHFDTLLNFIKKKKMLSTPGNILAYERMLEHVKTVFSNHGIKIGNVDRYVEKNEILVGDDALLFEEVYFSIEFFSLIVSVFHSREKIEKVIRDVLD